MKNLLLVLSISLFIGCGDKKETAEQKETVEQDVELKRGFERDTPFTIKEIAGVYKGNQEIKFLGGYTTVNNAAILNLYADGTYSARKFISSEEQPQLAQNGVYRIDYEKVSDVMKDVYGEVIKVTDLHYHRIICTWQSPWGERVSKYYIDNGGVGSANEDGGIHLSQRSVYPFRDPKLPSFISNEIDQLSKTESFEFDEEAYNIEQARLSEETEAAPNRIKNLTVEKKTIDGLGVVEVFETEAVVENITMYDGNYGISCNYSNGENIILYIKTFLTPDSFSSVSLNSDGLEGKAVKAKFIKRNWLENYAVPDEPLECNMLVSIEIQ